MRRLLDAVYWLGGALAALFIVGVGAVVLAQVGLNLLDAVGSWATGRRFGLVIPSYAEFAGFCFSAASFLALAPTWRADGHIRVSLLIQRVPAAGRAWVELWCLLVAAAIAGFFTFHAAQLALASFAYGDLSPGLVPVPLWLPQSGMALGLAMLTLAVLDSMVAVLRGGLPGVERVRPKGSVATGQTQPRAPLPAAGPAPDQGSALQGG